MKNCLQCNSEFEPKNPKGKFCSDKCKLKFSREKKKEAIKEQPEEDLYDAVAQYRKDHPQETDELKIATEGRFSNMALFVPAKVEDKVFKFHGPQFLSDQQKELIEIGEVIKPLLVELKMNAAEFVKFHRALAETPKIEKKSTKPLYTGTKDGKVLNQDAPKTKQMQEPPVGSNAYFLKYGKWE